MLDEPELSPYHSWSPARMIAGVVDIARCHECAGLVAAQDAAAHRDWHREMHEHQVRVEEIIVGLATMIADAAGESGQAAALARRCSSAVVDLRAV